MKQYQIRGKRSNEIAASVERAVNEGRLAPGSPLPTVRALAKQLGRSVGTIALAYRTLQARGVIVSRGRLGTTVRPASPATREVAALEMGEGVRNLADGNPDPRLLPPLARALRAVPREPVLYGVDPHDPQLLERAARSFKADGLGWSAIAVVGGALDGIERALEAQLRPGDRVAVEDPVYPAHLDLLGALGLVAEPVKIDARGMLPDLLARAIGRGAKAMIHSPRAQNPLGAAIDTTRQAELAAVLEHAPNLFVIEDDHAWLVAGVPYRSLATARERWFAARSFSKAFGPDLRIAVAAGDPITIARVKERQRIGVGWVSHVIQSMARSLWEDPEVLAMIEAARETYATRREALVSALAEQGFPIEAPSGLNCWVPVQDEAVALAGLRSAGFAAAPGARFALAPGPAIRITAAGLAPREAPAVAEALAATRIRRGITRTA